MDVTAISHCFLFNSINADELASLLSRVEVKEVFFAKNEMLAMQDEPCNRLIILQKGSVKAEMTDSSGKVVKVEDIYAPNPLAILFLFGTKNRFPVQITALEHSEAMIIPKQSVLKMLGLNEQLLKNYLDISANFASRLSDKLYFMSFRTIRQKLISYLLSLPSNNGLVVLDKSQQTLSEYFGVSRPSLSRELANMVKDNLILVDKKQIKITDREKLIQLIKFS
ncbi:MAG: Crp/Fnr family transcriptional regulator [Dysgonomonas sp.]